MKFNRRTNTIIMWLISIGLLLGMIVTFTPTMGMFGAGNAVEGQTVLLVNDEPITELAVSRARQNPVFNAVTTGQIGEDVNLLLAHQMIRETVLRQAASRERVSSREVRQEVEDFRQSAGVGGRQNDQAYLQLIGQSGFTDQSFRAYMEQQLKLSKYEDKLLDGVEVSDSEVETFYLANQNDYMSDARIRARSIVVAERDLAQELYERVQAGEDFAELAAEHSLQRADRGGALGAPAGSTEPQPVGRAALPTAAASAAFGLGGPGLTQPVQASGQWHLVQVEEYLPAQVRPLEEVAEQVREDALAAKQAGIVNAHVDELVEQANIVERSGELNYEDYPVARVGGEPIMATDLVMATYSNPQIQQSLSPDWEPLIVDFFKPTILESLIDQKLAYLGAQELDAEFVGGEGQVAQQALAYVSRDVEVDDAQVQEHYEANLARFTLPAEATAVEVAFESQDDADAYRAALLEDGEADAEEFNGTSTDLGTVNEGQLADAIDRALFGTDAFEGLPGSDREVSDVLVVQREVESEAAAEAEAAADAEADADAEDAEAGAEEADAEAAEADSAEEDAAVNEAEADQPEVRDVYVVLVAQRTPERVLPLEEVRAQIEQEVLQQERARVQSEWVDELRGQYEVENILAEQRAAEEAEALEAAAEAAEAEAATEAETDAETGEAAEGASAEEAAEGAEETAGEE